MTLVSDIFREGSSCFGLFDFANMAAQIDPVQDNNRYFTQ
jgi:hypothetical protein